MLVVQPTADAIQYPHSSLTGTGVQSVALSHHIRFHSQTHVGMKRSHNQDACVSQPAADERHFASVGHVFVVADGMGGHAVGEKASAQAVRDIPLIYRKHVPGEGPEAAIRRSFVETNAGIYQIGANNPEFKGLGTTGCALFLRPEGAWVGHVGDSRVYRVRDSKVEQLTFDHSWVWEIARRQGLDPDDLGDFKRNVIIRSLGPEAEVEPDVEGPHPVEPGDSFVMCSDGLTNHVRPDEIGAVVAVMTPVEACNFLVELANLRGGSDNVTCLVVQVPRGDGTSTDALTPPKRGGFARLLKWWGRHVTWPLTLLVLGGVMVALSIWMKVGAPAEVAAWVVVAFVLATLCTLGGLGGLVLQLLRKKGGDAGATGADGRTLNIHKTHPFDVNAAFVQRFTDEQQTAKKKVEAQGVAADEAAVGKWDELAAAKAKAGDWPAAFRARCQALQLFAAVLNSGRGSGEQFKPNYGQRHNGPAT